MLKTRPAYEFADAATEGLRCMHDARPENDVFEPIDVIPFDFAGHHVKLQVDGDVGIRHPVIHHTFL